MKIRPEYLEWWNGLTNEQKKYYSDKTEAKHLFEDARPIAKPPTESKNRERPKPYQRPTVSSSQPSQIEQPPSSQESNLNRGDFQSPETSVQSSQVSSSGDINMAELVGTALPQGGVPEGDQRGRLPLYKSPNVRTNFGRKLTTYKKIHRLMSFGIAHAWITKNVVSPAENQRYLTTFLAEVPWQKPFFYMTPSEFDLIPNGSYCNELRISIIHRGNRIAFETSSTVTKLATLNQIQNIGVAFGLNKTGWGTNFHYNAFSPSEKMKPTDLQRPNYQNYQDVMYGNNNNAVDFTDNIPNTQLGFKLPIRNYFAIVTSTDSRGGVPPLQNYINFYDGKTTTNECVGEFNWKPKLAPLKKPLLHIRSGLPFLGAGNLHIPINGSLADQHTATLTGQEQTTQGQDTSVVNTATTPTTRFNSNQFSYTSDIDKSQTMRQGPWGQYEKPKIQPSVHVGIQPIPALTSTDIASPVANWTDAQADWEIIAEMDVIEYLPTMLPYASNGNVPAGDVVFGMNSDLPQADSCSYAGLHPREQIRGLIQS